MPDTRRKLPIGVQTFAHIISEGYYYVDKTPLAWRLAESGKYYFLSRPRRFGKSLFLDTLKELFEGNEPLFRGLYIHDRWDWSIHHPVIRLSFGGGVLHSRVELDEKIGELLEDQQRRLQVTCTHDSLSGRFHQLIQGACEQTGQRVVVLVDEYDKPILDNLTNRETALAMREGLKNLYSVIKDADAALRLVFLTGVSKFSKVSLFSGLNNLLDLTVSPPYSAICGYTETDVDTVFAPELAGLDREEIRRWYNGYNWRGEPVYNPFDLLLLFSERQFRPWWFETGTPSFLIQRLTERQTWLPALGQLESDAELLATFDVDDMPTEALLFQTGYLTIDREELLGSTYFYRLRFPNHEVYQSTYNSLLRAWTANPQAEVRNRKTLYRLLQAGDLSGLKELFQAFFATIPHQWYDNNPISRYEGYYASVFYSYFAALGLDITLEDATNHGRIDMTVQFEGGIYLFEFKVVELTANGSALQQIKDKGYAEKYRALGQPIYMIGVEFSRDSRNIVGFEVGAG
ncbi:MAG: ATP-binding protein [Candidatus Competibacteraceae bacterium]|nr:ATP-binding protein [Candidatus Competibacteraceae bacterium]